MNNQDASRNKNAKIPEKPPPNRLHSDLNTTTTTNLNHPSGDTELRVITAKHDGDSGTQDPQEDARDQLKKDTEGKFCTIVSNFFDFQCGFFTCFLIRLITV
jgi:hypothetical protein